MAGIVIRILVASFHFGAKVESIARKLEDETGQKVFDQKKADLENVFQEKYKTFLEQWKVESNAHE